MMGLDAYLKDCADNSPSLITKSSSKLGICFLLQLAFGCGSLTDRSPFWYTTQDERRIESEANAESTRIDEASMQQDSSTQTSNTQETTHVTLLKVEREVGLTCGTLKKYLTYLGIEPICFHIGTRSLYVSREAIVLVQRLKENPALLAQLPSLNTRPPGSSQRETTGFDKRKDTSDGL
jgi:hypothetical protein